MRRELDEETGLRSFLHMTSFGTDDVIITVHKPTISQGKGKERRKESEDKHEVQNQNSNCGRENVEEIKTRFHYVISQWICLLHSDTRMHTHTEDERDTHIHTQGAVPGDDAMAVAVRAHIYIHV